MKKILIVEDDVHINNMIKELLLQNKYSTKSAYSGTEALMCIDNDKYDLILLDLMLPGLDGKQVIEKLRHKYDTPIIVLTAIDETNSKIEILRIGADDYITKPFSNDELIARMEVIFRRNKENKEENNIITYKNIVIDRNKFEVKINEILLSLTKIEYLVLELLVSNPDKVFTKSNIFESVWNEEFLGDENVINVHISNLRQKISKIEPDEEYIKTIWGIGFKIN